MPTASRRRFTTAGQRPPKQPADLQTSKQDAEDELYDRLRNDTNEQLHPNLV
jgi:hypothetical protein